MASHSNNETPLLWTLLLGAGMLILIAGLVWPLLPGEPSQEAKSSAAEYLEAGRALDTPVAMCGEMAGDPRFTRLLLGIGLRQFSMQPDALLDIKGIVLGSDTRELRWHTARLFARLDEVEPGQLLDALNQISN